MGRWVATWAVVLAALVLAALRVRGETGAFFQAVAHLYVGGLIGAWLVLCVIHRRLAAFDRRPELLTPLPYWVGVWADEGAAGVRFARGVAFRTAAGLSAVETACAVAGFLSRG